MQPRVSFNSSLRSKLPLFWFCFCKALVTFWVLPSDYHLDIPRLFPQQMGINAPFPKVMLRGLRDFSQLLQCVINEMGLAPWCSFLSGGVVPMLCQRSSCSFSLSSWDEILTWTNSEKSINKEGCYFYLLLLKGFSKRWKDCLVSYYLHLM